MRLVKLVAAALLALGLPMTASTAGLLELSVDGVSRQRNCDTRPCLRNDLSYRTRYMRDRYLRYNAIRTPPKYVYVPTTIVTAPPPVANYGQNGRYEYLDGNMLLQATGERTRTYGPPATEQVDLQVLTARAKYHIQRVAPYSAWYAHTVVVRGPCVPGTYGCVGIPIAHDMGSNSHEQAADTK